jgi:hypothetical protein
MFILRAFLVFNLVWVNACASSKVVEKKASSRTMVDVYTQGSLDAKKEVAQFVEKNLKEQKTFGYVKPYIPVMNQPVVRKVWIPDHKSESNRDVMVAGHWLYLMIQPSSWYIEGKTIDSKLSVIVPSMPEIR